MKIALAQINPRIGDCDFNVFKIQRAAEKAMEAGASILVCPELSVCGYPPQDLLDTPSFVDYNLECVEKLAAEFPSLTLVVGFVDKNPSDLGRRFYNAAALLKDSKIAGVYHKQLLPNYDVFDEQRYFEPGKPSTLVFEESGIRFGITICEDIWNIPGFLPCSYSAQPLEDYAAVGVDWLVNLSASPFHLGKPQIRETLFRQAVQKASAGLLFCNQVGANDDLIFDGASGAIHSSGRWTSRAACFREEVLIVDTEETLGVVSPTPTETGHWLYEALALGIRDQVSKVSGQGVVLGLSGGVDSSVVAALAAEALGPEKVLGVLLPSHFTSAASREDAASLAHSLRIPTLTVPIESLFESASEILSVALKKKLGSVVLENLQPRLRMLLLMGIANEKNLLPLNTSNKSELACGYATLYGDQAGILGVLGDCTKDQVYEIAKWINRSKKIIPQNVLDRAPTAELREGQKDEDTLPPYSVLDDLVREAVEKNVEGKVLKTRFPPAQVEKFLQLYRQSEFKRRQFAPILRVSSHAFGRGRRIPLASKKPW